MGYFSELTINSRTHEDLSYSSPEWQLKERINDLMDRLTYITGDGHTISTDIDMGRCLLREDIEYALSGRLLKHDDVILAIAFAKRKLTALESKNKEICNLDYDNDIIENRLELSGQILIWDTVPKIKPMRKIQIVSAA